MRKKSRKLKITPDAKFLSEPLTHIASFFFLLLFYFSHFPFSISNLAPPLSLIFFFTTPGCVENFFDGNTYFWMASMANSIALSSFYFLSKIFDNTRSDSPSSGLIVCAFLMYSNALSSSLIWRYVSANLTRILGSCGSKLWAFWRLSAAAENC